VCDLNPPGVSTKITHTSPKAFMTETNRDNEILCFEEMRSGVLFSGAGGDKTGATEQINLEKNRLTSFCALTETPFTDDATGRRTTIKSKSSHQNVSICLTNQYLKDMDPNQARRYIVFFMPKLIGAGEGSDVADQSAVDAYLNDDANRAILMRHRQVNAAFVWMSGAIKAGVIPDVMRSAIELAFDCVRDDMRKARGVRITSGISASLRHYVLQLTRNLALHQACWEGLYGPLGVAYYQQEGSAARWSPRAMMEIITPWMVPMKEHLVVGATMLEHLYTPFYLETTLRVLAVRCLHFDNVALWQHPWVAGHTPGAEATQDYNYLCLHGARDEDICDFIRENTREFELRAEDIYKLLSDLEKSYVYCDSLGVPSPASAPYPAPLANVDPAPRRMLRFDTDTVGSAGGAQGGGATSRRGPMKRRLCVAIRFLEQRFNLKMEQPHEISALLTAQSKTREMGEAMTRRAMRAHGKVGDDRSPLLASVRKVLSHPVFETDRDLARWIAPTVLPPRPFITAYVPPPVTFYTSPPPAAEPPAVGPGPPPPPPLRETRTVAMHGSHQMLDLKAVATNKPLMRENHTRLTATAKRTFTELVEDVGGPRHERVHRYEKSIGFVANKTDFDSTVASEHLKQLCHPGLPFAERLFYGGDTPLSRQGKILPLAFGPVYYRMYRQLAMDQDQTGDFLDYPEDNLRGQLKETKKLVDGARSGKYEHYTDLHDLAGEHTFAGLTFTAAAAALSDVEDDDDDAMNIF
jgi:hypothetical protein